MRHFTARDLAEHLSGADPLLLDVREPWEFAHCHIDGSLLIPMREIQDRVKDLDPERETVVICHHGIRSRHIARFLESVGFRDVVNLEGGVEQWARDVEPTMQRY